MERRFFAAGMAALVLTGCTTSTGGGVSQSAAKPAARLAAVANPDFDRWLVGARARAKARGISDKTLSRSFPTIGYLPGVIKTDRNQSEFKRSFEDYMAIATSESRVATGRAMLSKHAALFSRIEAKYGVEKEVVAAVWGLESRYGSRRGDIPTLSALATLAYDGRRGAFFEGQLVAALNGNRAHYRRFAALHRRTPLRARSSASSAVRRPWAWQSARSSSLSCSASTWLAP